MLSGPGNFIVQGSGFADLMARAPVFNKEYFGKQLALDKELEASMMNTAMQGGAAVKEAKIIADSNVKQAEIAAEGNKGQRLAALLPLLGGGLGSTGGRMAGQVIQLPNGDPSAALGSYNQLTGAFIDMDKLTKYWSAPGAATANGMLS